jgi:hypothetical protein
MDRNIYHVSGAIRNTRAVSCFEETKSKDKAWFSRDNN